MILSHIVAVSQNFAIGRKNRLPWHMPDDLRYFHDVTRGHTVIMGRKNYHANGGALKGRTNIVITRKADYHLPDAMVTSSIEEAINIAVLKGEKECFIVGGGEIYRQTLERVDRIYLTLIDVRVEGDVYYPQINLNDYTVLSREDHQADERNPYNWTYYVLET